ncbi:HNH endonuclease [Klebsiella pneumoniae]|uniref:HNH endonuclease n=1 Tax=Klebsiella TaxID=570 RepID=UPI002168038B|nr:MULTISPECIES: HNH endonuclease [Klebsiella]EKV6930276.1 HNH endonuclease [Klebsiella pneumoniae]EKV8487791.1 HNH endonuclease [Klebsiella pneumoniae]MCS4427261.1 HNH endonuclease [Klebsiella quasipneumoniae subsp. similipneumoniae]HED4010386.1 HNH endonuclease [Klebsiella variicola subsp. variicola]
MRRLHRPECPNTTALRNNYKHPENKLALQQASYGKCMYCESYISNVYFGDVEHIRPKAQDKYPELEFTWTNHGFCCARCNNAKSDQFDEDCPLLDPYSEDPSIHILAFGSLLRNKRGSERGAITISTIELNRVELVERRAIRINELQNAIDACYRTSSAVVRNTLLTALAHESDPDKEYSMVAAALIEANQPEQN